MAIQDTMRALSDPIRRQILNLLKKGPLPAGDIAGRFDVTGAAISRHLAVLRQAGLIRDRREGKYIYYELNASVLEEVMLWLAELKGENDETNIETV
ncbi:MAG: winged helix-turn-helix transcriptional regulator [Ruminococcaceae bacterium]|nr:winged helix-turn-helix transcriptional regulator [Oscillospiraceae bacterium]